LPNCLRAYLRSANMIDFRLAVFLCICLAIPVTTKKGLSAEQLA
jgi:hypothetical protein